MEANKQTKPAGSLQQSSPVDFKKTAVKVSNVSIVSNIILSAMKLFAGIIANSTAMVSDAIHSASDVFASFIVIIGVRISTKESDADHQYGHERFESVAALLLSIVLGATGVFIGKGAIETLVSGEYMNLQMPGMLALIAAIVSIVCKEAMYWYTRHYAKLVDSGALMAEAWHHRSDALSSVGSLIGIIGSRMGLAWFDPAASIVICLFILKAAIDIFKDAINKMVDHACDESVVNELRECAQKHPACKGIKEIYTREFGNKIYVDIEVYTDGSICLADANKIAKEIHDAIEDEFPKVKHIEVSMRAI